MTETNGGETNRHLWGYADSKFEFDGERVVRFTGSRYPICGQRLPRVIPFAEKMLGVPLRPEDLTDVKACATPASRASAELIGGIKAALGDDAVSCDDEDRLSHSHGQLSVAEVYSIIQGTPPARVVDAVAYPTAEEHLVALVDIAARLNACLAPYGGGTNVSGALACPTAEERPIISVDMRRMNRVLSVDARNMTAEVEAGITGVELDRCLAEHGFVSGHEPDSMEFSTLGGWISTNASGMKKNRYGNIEDIVLGASLVTADGVVRASASARAAASVRPDSLLFGSEGNIGIISKATLKVYPAPQRQSFGSFVFPSFAAGAAFLEELRRRGEVPASCRLVNNREFLFGQALKSADGGWLEKLQKLYLFRIKKFDLSRMCACTVVMEGTAREVARERRIAGATARRHGGIAAGEANGRRGYTLTFAIAYIRDFLSSLGVVGETFETSVPWSRIHDVCGAVERTLAEGAERHAVPGKPYLAYRITQTYHTGVCIYFTMGFCARGVSDPIGTYHDIEDSIRQAILDAGGNVSHHHGVGKIRRKFLRQVQTPAAFRVLRGVKTAADPNDIFCLHNGAFGEEDRHD